ncbi:hypothetical protein MMC07_002332 [Pseudocyphellaria aurata]|nr:hypothetical protein [Pseudocyphellaria aurata]
MRERSDYDRLDLPPCRHLIVTTTKGVFTWGSHGIKEVFHSGSGGIVAARKARNGSSLLAVADSQVVVLHDTRKGMQKSYKLRGSDGQLRLLRYAGDSKSLFFTTTLQNAVQAYSLQDLKPLNPSYDHPSPPTVFAISSKFHLLLSASALPPTIHLTNLLFNEPPILLHPQCSQSAVTAAAFHPERPNVFLLAFADRTCATYDAARLLHDSGRGERRLGPASSGAWVETMFIKNVHAMSNTVTNSALEETQGYDASTGVAVVGNKGVGITAAAFVPGYKSKFVTIGQDGKCCVIDLTVPGKKEARVVHSWHVHSPAASLSITPFNHDYGVFGHDSIQAREDAKKAVKGDPLIAIGCKDGRVLLFDLHGNQLGSETFHPDGTRVVDVEWMSGDDTTGLKSSKSGHRVPHTPPVKAKRKRVGSVLGRGRVGTQEILSIMDGTDEMVLVPARESSVRDSPAKTPDGQRDHAATILNHMNLFSPIRVLSEAKATKRRASRKHERDSEGSEATIKAINEPGPRVADDGLTAIRTKHFDEEHLSKPSIRGDLSHPIPQRPNPGKGDPVLAPRAEIAPKPLVSQRTTAKVTKPTRGLALSAPYMKPNIIVVPAKSNHSKNRAPIGISNAQIAASPEANDDTWTDIAPEPHQPTPTASRKPSTKRSRNQNQFVAFRSPSSGPSEASNDTVIDWAAASSRPPNPLLPLLPSRTHQKPSKRFKTGHVGLSTSSMSDDTMVQWSSFKKKAGFNIHNDLSGSTSPFSSSHPLPTNLHNLPPIKPLAITTHNPKIKTKSSLSRTPKPSSLASPTVPTFLFSSLQPHPGGTTSQVHRDGGMQQTDGTQPPRTVEQSTPSPRADPSPGSMKLFSSILQRELQWLRADLKKDLAQQLAVQRFWFDAQLAASRDERRGLEEEIRLLRGKLVVERRTKSSGGGRRR